MTADKAADLDPQGIRQACIDDPTTRERDLAMKLGISEAEIAAAWCGQHAARLDVRVGEPAQTPGQPVQYIRRGCLNDQPRFSGKRS